MDIKRPGLEYRMAVTMAKPWRALVTLTEFRLDKPTRFGKWKVVPTGRSWTEPFDPDRGDEEELAGRFEGQIGDRSYASTDVVQTSGELTLDGIVCDHLSACFCLEPLEIPPRFFQLIKKRRLRKLEKSNA